MTDKVWCKREKELKDVLNSILLGGMILTLIVVTGFSILMLIGFIVGYIPNGEPGSPILTDIVVAVLLIMSFAAFNIVLSSPPDGTYLIDAEDVRLGWVFFCISLVISALSIIAEFFRFDPIIGIVGSVIAIPIFLWMYIHIKCKEEEVQLIDTPRIEVQ